MVTVSSGAIVSHALISGTIGARYQGWAAAACAASALGAGNVPVSMTGERMDQIDFRVAKVLRFGRTRTLAGIDIFNATNSSAIRAQNPTYGPQWLTPIQILQPRFVKLSLQLDF